MEGISLCHKALLVAIFSLLALSISPGLTMAKTIDADPIDVKPFFQDNGFVVNTKKAPYLGEQYWLEKQEAIEKYEIDLSAGYKTNLKDGLYPLIFKKAPEEDLFQYYKENFGLSDDYIKDLVNGTKAFAYIKIDGDQARLVSTDSDKLVVNYNFPIGNYSISLLSSDHSELANWPCRVVDKYPAADIFAVETVYNTLTLTLGDSDKIYGNIDLPIEKIVNNKSVKISWTSSDSGAITAEGIVTRADNADIPVTLTAYIVSGSFSMNKDFNLLVAKKDPYLEKVEFTVNSQRMEHKDNYHFWLQKQNGVKSYRLDFGDYKTNLQDGKYAIRFDDLSSELRESLQKYYDSNSEGLSEEEIQSMINGKESCAYIQVFGGKLSLISARKADIKLSFSTAIIGIDSNPLLISAEYPNGVYNIIADLDGLAGSNKVKWQVEVVPEEVIVDPDIALVEADRDALSLSEQVTEDFILPTSGDNGSSIRWESDNTAIVIDGNNAKVTRPDFAAGDAIVHLTATLSKGSVSRAKSFTLKVLKKAQVIIPPTTGGGGGGGGIAGSVVPQSINAINFPLNLIGSQNGVLTQSFANGLSAKLTVVPNSFTGNVTFKIADGPEDNAVGGSHFAITATDSNGNYVRNFANNLNITFSGLTLPDNTAGLGVYYYDEALLSWVLVPGAIFNQADGSVSFSVNHLTNFAVFAEQPVTQQVLGQTAYANGTLLRGSDKHIFVVVDGKLQRILNLQELAQYYSDQEILQVEDSVIAGYAKVPSRAVLGDRKYNFTRDLKIGSTGDDVQELQKYLNNNGYIVSKTGAGSPGQETKMFGRATRDALIKFQKANNITPAVGYFGPVTRKVVNK